MPPKSSTGRNPNKRAAKRLRARQRKQVRKLLDQAYREFLDTLRQQSSSHETVEPPPSTSQLPQSRVCPPSPGPEHFRETIPVPIQVPNQSVVDFETSPTSPDIEIVSIYSDITEPGSSEKSRPSSPTNSITSSVEFIDELPAPPPKSYYDFGCHSDLESLISQFPQRTAPLPKDSYTIGPLWFRSRKNQIYGDRSRPHHTVPRLPSALPTSLHGPSSFFLYFLSSFFGKNHRTKRHLIFVPPRHRLQLNFVYYYQFYFVYYLLIK